MSDAASPAPLAEIVSIGSELADGFTVDRHAAFLARELRALGLRVTHHHTIGDDPTIGAALFEAILGRARFVVVTGGLGPTGDDRTRDMIAAATSVELDFDEACWGEIRGWLASRSIPEVPGHREQARIPRGAHVLVNALGTAPGFVVEHEGTFLAALPGVPSEMHRMFRDELVPWMTARMELGAHVSTRVLRLFGIAESRVDEPLAEAMGESADPRVGITVSRGELSVYLTSRHPDEAERSRRLDRCAADVRERFGEHVFGEGEASLADVVGAELVRTGTTVALAESCTGGLVAEMLTNVPGISSVFLEGAVTYSNEAKVRTLGVDPATLAEHGAVSEPVAQAMAAGIARRAGTDIGVGITGIAGPGGGSDEKPVGLVYIGYAVRGEVRVDRHVFRGDRAAIRRRAALEALFQVLRALRGAGGSS